MTGAELVAQLRHEGMRRHLEAFLRRQRWFGGRGVAGGVVDVVDAVALRESDPDLWIVLLAVRHEGAETELYHLPLARRPLATAAVTAEGDARLVAVAAGAGGHPTALYDALADPGALEALWQALNRQETHRGAAGAVRCRRLAPVARHHARDGDVVIRPLAKEQSNSAAVRGDSELLKCLRRVVRGASPEVEMTTALTAAGFTHVAPALGTVEYLGDDGVPILLALVQPYLHNGSEGWAMALTSLRVHYADAEEAEDLPGRPGAEGAEAVALRGATFTPEAARIGELTAAMHLALLHAGRDDALRPEPVGAVVLERWAAEMTADLDRLLAQDGEPVASLRSRRETIAAAFAELRGLHDGGTAIRVHGDYHLGQLLRTDDGWTVLDFEGEPSRPLEERRARSSALNDVAGMLRSFDYAAAVALSERVAPGRPGWNELLARGDAWSAANRDAFWTAYRGAVAGSGLLPAGDGAEVLLHAFQLRKAVYEVLYEIGHRPDWVSIPLRFLLGRRTPA